MSESLGISVQNVCYECMVIARDTDEGFLPMQCQTCIDDAEARADDNAWNLHEDDRLGEGKCLSLDTSDAPSASEWVASETYVRTYGEKEKKPVFTEKWKEESMHLIELAVRFIDPDEPVLTRHEFLPPIAQLQDGGTNQFSHDMSSYHQSLNFKMVVSMRSIGSWMTCANEPEKFSVTGAICSHQKHSMTAKRVTNHWS